MSCTKTYFLVPLLKIFRKKSRYKVVQNLYHPNFNITRLHISGYDIKSDDDDDDDDEIEDEDILKSDRKKC